MDWIPILVSAIAVVLTFLGIMWKMTKDLRDERDEKLGGVFKRFDEFKEHVRDSHVSKEMFAFVHKQMVQDIGEIKNDVKTLLRNRTKDG